MKEVFLLSKEEKRELESITSIMLSITDSFDTFTNDKTIDGDINDERLESIAELRNRMKHDMIYLEKSYNILLKILNGNYNNTLSVQDYELGK